MMMTKAESHAEVICEFFPDAKLTRTRDVIQVDVGGERGCVLLVTAEAVEIRLPTIEWTGGACDPRASSRYWKRVPIGWDYEEVRQLIEAGIRARVAQYQRCAFCGEEVPPEHRTGDACHGCASKHRGIIY